MRPSRILALSGLALILSWFLVACGGSSTPAPTPTAPTITSTTVPQATINVAYSFYLQASGGSGTYTWAITAGTLPPGITFNDQTAQLSGTPTSAGTYPFTAKVTDSNSLSGSANLTLVVGGAVLIKCNSCASGTMTLPSGNPGVAYSATISASGGVAPYTWCVVETSGSCDNGSGGALPPGLTINASTGVISGTPTTPGTPTQFTVQATDSEQVPSRGTAQLTLTIIGVVTKSLPNDTIYVPYSGGTLTVAGGISPYTWSITVGSLPPGLSLGAGCSDMPTCTISGTPSQAGTYSFTVQVKDGETSPAVATAQLSIDVQPITNGLLTGNYAFALNGYKNGNPFIMAAAFITDGNGNITSGYLDLNDGSGLPISGGGVVPQTIASPGSVYSLNADGTGSMTIVTNEATYQFEIAVTPNACAPLSDESTCGRVIESDPSDPQTYGSGALLVQDPQYFIIQADDPDSFLPGNFALLVRGTDPQGNRYAGAGALGTNPMTLVDVDCNGNGWGLTTGCPLNIDDNGNAASDPMKGSFGGSLDPNTGRGNDLGLSFPDDPNGICLGTIGSSGCTYAYYIINQVEMIAISADPISKPANLALWTWFHQLSSAGGWLLTALKNSSVVELNAVVPNGGSPEADVTAGLLVANGAGSATIDYDENEGGTLHLQQSSQGTYSISTTGNKTGEVTFSGFSTQFGTTPPVLYLYRANTGFFVGTDAKVTSGILEPQSAPPFTDDSVMGGYAGGSNSPVLSAVTNSVTALFANGAGNIMATQYTSGSGGPGGPTNLTLTYQVDGTGRAVVMQNGNTYGILYVVSPTKFVLLPAGSAPALEIFVAGPGF